MLGGELTSSFTFAFLVFVHRHGEWGTGRVWLRRWRSGVKVVGGRHGFSLFYSEDWLFGFGHQGCEGSARGSVMS